MSFSISLKDNPFVLHEPEPRVRYRDFGDWAVEFGGSGLDQGPTRPGIARDLIIRGISPGFSGWEDRYTLSSKRNNDQEGGIGIAPVPMIFFKFFRKNNGSIQMKD